MAKKLMTILSEVRILQPVDRIAAEKDHAADKLLHDRHEQGLEKVEARLGMKGLLSRATARVFVCPVN